MDYLVRRLWDKFLTWLWWPGAKAALDEAKKRGRYGLPGKADGRCPAAATGRAVVGPAVR